jgi:hypothetical protein
VDKISKIIKEKSNIKKELDLIRDRVYMNWLM